MRKKQTENSRKSIRVSLQSLKPFSGVLVDEKGNQLDVSGNSFYVPDDYLNKDDKDSESIKMLHASIAQEGILTPLLVRVAKDEQDSYEILSGYRRKKVCEELSKTRPEFQEVPVIVIDDCDDYYASSIITSSNVQRREISFLDTIKSCGRMYMAMRHRGQRLGQERTEKIVGEIMGLKPRSVMRYSFLLELPEFMLELVGNKVKTKNGDLRLSINAGETLSGVDKSKLEIIRQVMENDENRIITMETAKTLKKFCKSHDEVSLKEIEEIIVAGTPTGTQDSDAEPKKRRFLVSDSLRQAINTYCPDMSDQELGELLSRLLKQWNDSADKAGMA